MDSEREFGELKARVEGLQASFTDFRSEMRQGLAELNRGVKERLDMHSRRLGNLERWRSWTAGALAMLAIVWMIAVAWWKR